MKELIARKYVKALVQSFNADEITQLLGFLKNIQKAMKKDKFKEIIATPSVHVSKKTELVLQVFGSEEPRFVNFIKLLGENGRFEIIPDICKELEKTISSMKNEYTATLTTNEAFERKVLKSIETSLAKKLKVRLALTQEASSKEGVRLIVDDLGIEVSFSKEKFINDLREHILKAF